MTTLQKFKLLATHCGVTQSPTRSPRTSPLVNFRRPKTTLRMFLTRTGSRKSSNAREMPYPQSFTGIPAEKKKGSGHSLKDLFVSSPSLEGGDGNEYETVEDKFGGKGEVVLATKVGGLNGLGGEPGSPRPGWMGFRHRMLLRKAWRPMLQTIHE
ncbi:nicotinamide adenine dinucleotide transporter 2 [Hibiscus syriacus]|uniref:Nicotinamide adenine dinucleotide transporter 2 n=1 Tax=Hibiscus syriacus TaxID=106335 RepID=A0A6A2XSY0_HIBSY|nr:uncharacterized protein LOC120171289 [Hibiscus syriacus]KAE8672980.1 nicotinamide adenine dinucleotide transporter 2 [Hibiscus syriacus]